MKDFYYFFVISYVFYLIKLFMFILYVKKFNEKLILGIIF